MEISVRKIEADFGKIVLVRLKGSAGESVELSNIGAGITSVIMPDREGIPAEITVGYENPTDYMGDGPCAGKTPGRFANRIAFGRFRLGEEEYQLNVNLGPNTLHGGPGGFHNRLWDWELLKDGVRFHRLSPDGEEHFPGNLEVTVEYRYDEHLRKLHIDYRAECDKATVVNLTNHTYFNLRGHDSGSCLDHLLELECGYWLPVNEDQIPLDDKASGVNGTPMDFRREKRLGEDIDSDFSIIRKCHGFDHYFMRDVWKDNKLPRRIARLRDPESGRVLEIITSYPGAMVYTGNWLNDSPEGRGGFRYSDYAGVAIECQLPPDAPNQPRLPQATLRPGEIYRHTIIYRFLTE